MAEYLSLFIWSFLASTILPLGVEPLFIYQVISSNSWAMPVFVASIGNSLGSFTILWMGYKGNVWIHQQVKSAANKNMVRVEAWTKKYGYFLLFFSWLPFVGDLLVLVISITKPPIWNSVLLLCTGKTLRFLTLAWLSLSIP